MQILQKRYPDIAFLLSIFPHKEAQVAKESDPLNRWLDQTPLEELEVIYIVGLIGFFLPKPLEMWLSEKRERALIFIEEELGAFAQLREDLCAHPQIHLYFCQEGLIEELARNFPTDRVAIFEYKPFDSKLLKRRSSAYSALYSDVLYSHKIVENVLTHALRLPYCFDMEGVFGKVPAIICGAGPSLDKLLKNLQKIGDQALIFAGGSAITTLSVNGVRPHFAVAVDPNEEEFTQLKKSYYFEGPFLFAPRLQRNVFATTNGPFGYMRTHTGGLIEPWIEKVLKIEGGSPFPDLGSEAFSVTTLSLGIAYAMGCDPIYLAGVDLAYTGGRHYASGLQSASSPSGYRALEEKMVKKDIQGKPVTTLLKWVMEADSISAFAKAHPERSFFNVSEGGLGFRGITNTSLSEGLKGAKSYDLYGAVHSWIQSRPLMGGRDRLGSGLMRLKKSLRHCGELCRNICLQLSLKKESGSLALYESDLQEEEAYSAFLEGIDRALDHLLYRYYPHIDPQKGRWERDQARFNELMRQIDRFSEVLDRVELRYARLKN